MKKLLIVGVTSLILFGVSASASYFWQQKQKQGHTESAEHLDPTHKESTRHGKLSPASTTSHASESTPARAAVRPAYNPGAEEIARLTNELRTRLAGVREREEQLTARKKQVELVHEDIRGERVALDELRAQVKSEMEALNDALQNVEKQRGTLEDERKKISKNTQEMEGHILQMQKDEQANLKKKSGMYNSMSPESAARILQNLADTGKMDTAVKVLDLMQERQAAKVLAELTDAGLAAQLVEKLKSLRRTPANPDGTKQ
ncbi:MAG: MotE family protein [Gemmataceae bacterium]